MITFDAAGIGQALVGLAQLEKQVQVGVVQFVRRSTPQLASAFQTSVRPYQRTTSDMVQSIRPRYIGQDASEVITEGRGAKKIQWIRYGTKPHVIRAKSAKALKFRVGGETLFRRSVLHPGTPAKPILDLGYRLSLQILEREAALVLSA